VIEEWIFDHAIKVEKVKATLAMWVHRWRFIRMKRAVPVISY